MTLRPCSDLSAAAWITGSDLSWDRLVTFGPSGFPAYGRLRLLPDPEYPGQQEADAETGEDDASESGRLAAVLQVLSRHTSTPEDCYFCLWDGWGSSSDSGDHVGMVDGRMIDLPGGIARPGLAPSSPSSIPRAPKVVVPNRAYFLYRGDVSELGDWGRAETWPDRPRPDTPPAFVWPADHAWCVANDVDPHWVGIGADTRAIEALTAHPLLDVVPADPREDQPSYR
ncbi:MAG: hypothetical protein QOI54_2079 [Actinomycetota bacterium]|nr:hypothetical protein [Actinomycetota bacterium]